MKNSSAFFLFIISLFTFFSCDDYFELKRPEVNPWVKVSDLQPMTISPYTALFRELGWQSPDAMSAFFGELSSDISLGNPYSLEQEAIFWYPRKANVSDISSLGIEQSYARIYQAIASCNVVLTFIEDKESNGEPLFPNMKEDDKNELKRIKGEMYFMRSYSYWLLSRTFLPPYHIENLNKKYIPYMTRLTYSKEELRNPKMGTMEEIYKLMISDFGKAKVLLPETNRQGFPTTYAASFMLMRLYFMMKDNALCLNECNYIIDSKKFDLTEDPIRAFCRNYESIYCENPLASEVIMDYVVTEESSNQPVPYDRMSKNGVYNIKASEGPSKWKSVLNYTYGARKVTVDGVVYDNFQHGSWAGLFWNPNTIKFIGWALTNDPFSEDYKPSDEALSDKRFLQLHYYLKGNRGIETDDKSEYEMNDNFKGIKYNVFWNDKYGRAPYGRYSIVPLMRLAEVYLTRASISSKDALSDVNLIRKRAGLTNLSSVNEIDIEKERIKELGFETSDRILYLVANNKPIPANGKRNFGESLSGYNPLQDGTPLEDINPPYNELCIPIPNIEYLYSGSFVTDMK